MIISRRKELEALISAKEADEFLIRKKHTCLYKETGVFFRFQS